MENMVSARERYYIKNTQIAARRKELWEKIEVRAKNMKKIKSNLLFIFSSQIIEFIFDYNNE